MEVRLDDRLMNVLKDIAAQQGRDVGALVQEAVEQYLLRERERARFDDDIRRIMNEHAWLLDQLSRS
jgi:predicted transcriptional regulator